MKLDYLLWPLSNPAKGLAVLYGGMTFGPAIGDIRAEHGDRTPPTERQLEVCHRQSEYAAIGF